MDVKNDFLYSYIEEEIYVEQPPSFFDFKHPNSVFKIKQAIYGLKLVPRSWYKRLSNILISQYFARVQMDKALFIKKSHNKLLLVQIYDNDIVFGSIL